VRRFFEPLTSSAGHGHLAHLCSTLDSADDAFMRPTAAQVFVQGLTNLRPGRLGGLLQQIAGTDQDAAQAIATLACVFFNEGLL
jgi:hypothetical protein